MYITSMGWHWSSLGKHLGYIRCVCVCVCVCGVCVECVLSVHGVCVVRERERDKEREAVKERR